MLVASMLAAQPGIAAAQGIPCLTQGEFASVTQYALPSAIDGAAARCGPSLPSNAFLLSDGARAMSARYADASRQSWPQAKAALLRIGGGLAGGPGKAGREAAMLAALPDPSLQQVLRGFVTGVVVARLPTDRCATVDRLLGLLAPLPATNTGGVVATIVGLITEKQGGKLGPVTICEGQE
jgi:hypothetical protein